jgi:hypothetical protein
MVVAILNKEYTMQFGRYKNGNISIVATDNDVVKHPVTGYTIMKLKEGHVAIRDAAYIIDDLIKSNIIKPECSFEVEDGSDKLFIYELIK